ncbi:MAG: toll/interleukin-1 receptor domain-containing protein [Bacteroidetes bacterium]|nr:toll/interleukin-1 receptor domain-containing protein [Bacteroidota bacterium]
MYLRKKRVFISYAREDKDAADRIADFLYGHGHEPFQDLRNIEPGEKWQIRTTNEMNSADVIVVLLSDTSLTKNGRIRFEFEQALQLHRSKNKHIIPVRIDKSIGSGGFDHFNIIDWSTHNQVKLLNALSRINKRWLILLLAISVCVLLAITLLLVMKFTSPFRTHKLNYNAIVVQHKNGTPLSGITATLVDEQNNTLARSAPSRSDGHISLSVRVPEMKTVFVQFSGKGVLELREKYPLVKSLGRLRTEKDMYRVPLFSASRRVYQTSGNFSLLPAERKHIETETGFTLGYDAPLVFVVGIDSSAIEPYGNEYVFSESPLVIYVNGRAHATAIYLPEFTRAYPKPRLLELLRKQQAEQIAANREELVNTIIELLPK